MADFKENLKILNDLDLNELIRADLGDELNFTEAIPIIEAMKALWKPFSEMEVDVFPVNSIQNWNNSYLNTFLKQTELIKRFQVSAFPNPSEIRDSILSALRTLLLESFEGVGGISSSNIKDSSALDKFKSKANEYLEEIANIKAKTKTESDSIIKNLRAAAGSIGVEVHSQAFKEEADNHKKYAQWWGVGTVVTMGIFVGLIIWLFFVRAEELKTITTIYQLIPLIGFRLFIVSLSYLVIYECIKNFNIHRHLNTENRFREKALMTFRTFVDAAKEDGDIKAAVLLATTNAVFSAPSTGYVSQNLDLKSNPPIFELARNTITPKGD